MVVTFQKPEYLPGLAYFDRIFKSDTCIFLDSIQLPLRDAVARTNIVGHNGPEFLVVSVKRSQKSRQLITDARIEDEIFWKKKHLKTLYHLYKNTPYFDETYPVLCEIIDRPWKNLADMNIELITRISSQLQLYCTFHRSSDFPITIQKTEHIVELIKAVGGAVYLADRDGPPYLCEEEFTRNGIALVHHDFQHPHYSQQRKPFTPGLSIVDALFNCGKLGVYSFFEPLAV